MKFSRPVRNFRSRKVEYPGSKVKYPSHKVKYPSSKVKNSSRKVKYPSRKVKYPSSKVKYPSPKVKHSQHVWRFFRGIRTYSRDRPIDYSPGITGSRSNEGPNRRVFPI